MEGRRRERRGWRWGWKVVEIVDSFKVFKSAWLRFAWLISKSLENGVRERRWESCSRLIELCGSWATREREFVLDSFSFETNHLDFIHQDILIFWKELDIQQNIGKRSPQTSRAMSSSNLNLGLFQLSILILTISIPVSSATSSSSSSNPIHKRDGWRPPQELDPTIPFILGGGVPAGYGVPSRNDKGPFNPWDRILDPNSNSKPSNLNQGDEELVNTTKLNGLEIDQLLLPQNSPPLHVGHLPKEASGWTWACNPIGECEPCPEKMVSLCLPKTLDQVSRKKIFVLSRLRGLLSSFGWLCGFVTSLPFSTLGSTFLYSLINRYTTRTVDPITIDEQFIA